MYTLIAEYTILIFILINFALAKDQVFKTYDLSMELLHENSVARSAARINLGSYYELVSDYSAALKLYNRAILIQTRLDSPNIELLSYLHNNIGNVYLRTGDPHRAIEYFEQANTYCESHINCIGSYENYSQQHNLSRALKRVEEIEKAKVLINRTIMSLEKQRTQQNNQLLINVNLTLAEIEIEQEDYSEADARLKRVYRMQSNVNDYQIARTHKLSSLLNRLTGNWGKASMFSKKYLETAVVKNNVSHDIEQVHACPITCYQFDECRESGQFPFLF